MKRGSFKRRLPRGRSSIRTSPAMIGLALFLVISVPTFFLISGLFQTSPEGQSATPATPPALDEFSSDKDQVPERILRIASIDSGLIATVKPSDQNAAQVYLENQGQAVLKRVKVSAEGKILGILSQLSPKETKILAMTGQAGDVKVSALDPSGKEVYGEVQYLGPRPPISDLMAFSGGPMEEPRLATQSVTSEIAVGGASLVSPSSPQSQDTPQIGLTITTNRSDGISGEAVAYRCTAINLGNVELSEVKIFCVDKMTSTGFLTPGKELHLDGVIEISDHLLLNASAQALDAKGRIYTNNSSVEIWEISPQISLEARVPGQAHRGDKVPLTVAVKNTGNSTLRDITVSDYFGEIGNIPVLEPGDSKTLHKDCVLEESVLDEVRTVALDALGRPVYASQKVEMKVLDASLEISAQPSETLIYPGQPAEVTWILSNSGEEVLKNITFGSEKRCMLKELSPGRTIRMAAIYTIDKSSWMNVTAQGNTPNGLAVSTRGGVFLRTVQPDITLKIQPSQIEVCPDEVAELSCLVTNSGDDVLTNMVLIQQGSTLATIAQMAPGEFRVVDTCAKVSSNSTLQFQVQAQDSRGKTWSDSATAEAKVVITALKAFASASPSTIVPGNNTKITCTVANTGSLPLYSIFVISKSFGPLGTIDFLPPKRQQMVSTEKTVWQDAEDYVTVEGFTQQKQSVRGGCNLRITTLKLPGMRSPPRAAELTGDDTLSSTTMTSFRSGNLSIPVNLPSEKKTVTKVSREITEAVDESAVKSKNQVLDGISNLLRYIQKVLERNGYNAETSASQDQLAQQGDDFSSLANKNYELSIEGVKGSEHGAIRILDVSATPSRPAPWEEVKVTAHVKSISGINSAKVNWGLADVPLTKQDMLDMDRIYNTVLRLESGDEKDGYWSCTIPGKAAGTYLVLSISLEDGIANAEAGPYMLHWSTVQPSAQPDKPSARSFASEEGMLFIESSIVRGTGEVSIKDTFHGASMQYDEKMKGIGSISIESLRCVDRNSPDVNFTEKKDLVFTGGQLKGMQRVSSPTFHGGLGASVTERFNLSHVDKSVTSSVCSESLSNNTLTFNTEQAFDGTWNIQTQYAKFSKKIKADQQYIGSFQTQKKIKFQDEGK